MITDDGKKKNSSEDTNNEDQEKGGQAGYESGDVDDTMDWDESGTTIDEDTSETS